MTDENIVTDLPEETAPEAAAEAAAIQEAPAPRKIGKIIKRVVYFLLLAVFVGIFIYCAIYITNYMVDSKQVSDNYSGLSDYLDQYRNPNSDRVDATLPSAITSGGSNTNIVESNILEEYRDFYAANSDMVGWISIPQCGIDYPVMQTPGNSNYYLYRGFDGKYSAWGCIYAREVCDIFTPCDNVVLYGHHMEDGSMFASLDKYKKKSFWQENQTFTFDTLYEHHTYQVIAVFKTSANLGEGFSYHVFNTAANEEEFNEYIRTVHSLQFYDTGVTAEYGDLLLTLSTCEYTLNNGRFVVVAKRIS